MAYSALTHVGAVTGGTTGMGDNGAQTLAGIAAAVFIGLAIFSRDQK